MLPAGRLRGVVRVPPSKSDSLRATLAASLAQGAVGAASRIRHASQCADQRALEAFLASVGVEVVHRADGLTVLAKPWKRQGEVSCGESGFLARVLPLILSAMGREVVVTGCGSLLHRPVGETAQLLELLGAAVTTSSGCLPLRTGGVVQRGIHLELPEFKSSQPLSGLLMAGPLLVRHAQARFAVSSMRPYPNWGYLAMTLRTLAAFGVRYGVDIGGRLELLPGSSYTPARYTVEGDWSAAAFLIVGALMGGRIRLFGLSRTSLQPDAAIAQVSTWPGVRWCWQGGALEVSGHLEELRPFEFDCSACPDLIPPLVALGSAIEGCSAIHGASKLASKESDRGAVLAGELGKLGVGVTVDGDTLTVEGHSGLKGGAMFSSHDDHRVAMAMACVSLVCGSPNRLQGWEAVGKSYPGFWEEWAVDGV